jgi:hypothetical protein
MEVWVTGYNLKVDHLRTIHAMFALNWLTGFKGKFFKTFFP